MSEKTLRVKQELVNQLLNIVGDVVSHSMEVDLLEKAIRGNGNNVVDTAMVKSLKDISVASKKTSDELVKAIMEIRMEPLGNMFGRFHSMVRSLGRDQGKKIDFQVLGEETLADKTVAEKMADPLVHILRNSVDHGIEPYEERVDLGKPEMGKIVLSATSDEENVNIYITDDGRGLDTEKIRNKAVAMGLISAEKAATLVDEDVNVFIFHPGFSTADKVTDVSGRGVGMDVVRRNVSELKAEIKIVSRRGAGTTIHVKIPLFRLVDIVDAMILSVDTRFFGISVKNVLRVVSFPKDKVHFFKDRPFVDQANEMIPLYKIDEILEDVFEENWNAGDDENVSFVVIGMGTTRIGLVFENVLNVQRVVIKKAEGVSGKVNEVVGLAGIGKGKMANILNPEYLIAKHLRKEKGIDPEQDEADEAQDFLEEVYEEQEAHEEDISGEVQRQKITEVLEAEDLESMDDIMSDVQEHMLNISKDLMLMESEPGKELFDRLFRGYHSIKGAFGALKLMALVAVTSEGEDLLHMLRESRIEIDETLVGLMFKLADVISAAVEELRNGYFPSIPVDELHEEFRIYKEEVAPDLGIPGAAQENLDVSRDTRFNLSFLEHLNLQKVLSSGGQVYEIYVRVSPEVIMQSVRAVILMTSMYHNGTIIATIPSPGFIEQSDDYRGMKILYHTGMEESGIKELLDGEEMVETCEIMLSGTDNLD